MGIVKQDEWESKIFLLINWTTHTIREILLFKKKLKGTIIF